MRVIEKQFFTFQKFENIRFGISRKKITRYFLLLLMDNELRRNDKIDIS